jgi:hypothetical protein
VHVAWLASFDEGDQDCGRALADLVGVEAQGQSATVGSPRLRCFRWL